MKFPALITGEEHRSGISKTTKQPWEMVTVTAVDRSKEGKCRTPLEFNLAKEDMDLAGQLDGQTVFLEIHGMKVYQGKIDFQVRVSRESEKPAATAAPSSSSAR